MLLKAYNEKSQRQLALTRLLFGYFSFSSFGDVGVSTGITNYFGDGLLTTLAYVRQQELCPPVEAVSLSPSVFLWTL
ncbi:hypothetical protein XM38_040050 [Halomicronema hongdechloris C2206]|uniref:Uncharacterized protein n=1 Tax=Halomicronema hongdechloris C2206 TaxID=1641165 RepID=A0A1Z3HRV6_9CYAN|nr:hypothetical protein XM38_040050 [Halomicronema hongdechloris C2206]